MRKGFTLVEIVVVLAIMMVLATVVSLNLYGNRGKTDLNNTTKQIAALLREAQGNAMAQESGVAWGVHFANATNTAPFYALMASSTYSTATVVGYYRLPPSITYLTSTLASGATLDVTFSPITGAASASTSIGLFAVGQALSATILISSSGATSY